MEKSWLFFWCCYNFVYICVVIINFKVITSVSYTHLDVYKRQEYVCTDTAGQRISHPIETVFEAALYKPVSYTHLIFHL